MENEIAKLANRAAVLAGNGDIAEAAAVFQEVLRLRPSTYQCRANLAITQLAQGDFDSALASYERAIADGLDPLEGNARLACIWAFKGNLARALTYLTDDRAALVKAKLLLAAGHFKEGWTLFERRNEGVWRPATPPYWRGEDLAGKTIFVWPEWILGDQLLFGGLLNELIAKAGKVVVESKPSLHSIFKRSFPCATVISQIEDRRPVSPPADADFQVPLNSLGMHLRPDFKSFPRHKGYLKSDAAKVAAVRRKYEGLAQGRKIVGLGWRSKNEKAWNLKCATLADWAILLRTPGVFWVNLLSGDWQHEVDDANRKLDVSVFRDDEIAESTESVFAHAAAMDMVVSTSNSVIHAAGSQNVPGWLIQPSGLGAFWYWFNDRDDSPFYPSVKIYRQPKDFIGERWWDVPIARAAADLESLAR